ncbi:MAG TPA: YitT family protein, partial [Rhizomicrobium sp.]|nr:YitT family protein [Rhizomicrobium sp.]
LIGSYLSGLSVGLLFSLINLPFLVLAQRTLGWRFAIKSAMTVALLSLFTVLIPGWLHGVTVEPLFAAIFGGTIIGLGILSLARHKTSVGGVGVVAIYLYEKRGINAGKVQGICDTLIIASAFLVVDARHLALSVLSAIALSLVLFTYHKPGRYTGY